MNINEFNSDSNFEEINRIVTASFNNEASQEQLDQLGDLILHNADARRLYVLYLESSYSLREWACLSNDTSLLDEKSSELPEANTILLEDNDVEEPEVGFLKKTRHKIGDFISKPISLSVTLSILFLVSVVSILAMISLSSDQTPVAVDSGKQEKHLPEVVASVMTVDRCRWVNETSARDVGDVIREDEFIKLHEGIIQIKFVSGATAILQGPVTFRLNSHNGASMMLGKSTFRVPSKAVGFTVETTTASLVDLGTEFGVEIDENKSTLINVFTGLVEAESKKPDGTKTGQKYQLKQGQAMRFNTGGKSKKLDSSLSENRFVRTMPNKSWEEIPIVNHSFELPKLESDMHRRVHFDVGKAVTVPGWTRADTGTAGIHNNFTKKMDSIIDGDQTAYINGAYNTSIFQSIKVRPKDYSSFTLSTYCGIRLRKDRNPSFTARIELRSVRTNQLLAYYKKELTKEGQWHKLEINYVPKETDPIDEELKIVLTQNWKETKSQVQYDNIKLLGQPKNPELKNKQ